MTREEAAFILHERMDAASRPILERIVPVESTLITRMVRKLQADKRTYRIDEEDLIDLVYLARRAFPEIK